MYTTTRFGFDTCVLNIEITVDLRHRESRELRAGTSCASGAGDPTEAMEMDGIHILYKPDVNVA